LKVVSVNISKKKGTAKTPVDSIELIKDHGVKGDAHAGPGLRQVSMLAQESYEKFNDKNTICVKHGEFGENIVTQGVILHKLALGTRFKIGTAEVIVSKIGKECHAPCVIGKKTGECIMPKEGIFTRVIVSGVVGKGDAIFLA